MTSDADKSTNCPTSGLASLNHAIDPRPDLHVDLDLRNLEMRLHVDLKQNCSSTCRARRFHVISCSLDGFSWCAAEGAIARNSSDAT